MKKLFFIIMALFTTFCSADMAVMAKMAAPLSVTAIETIHYFKTLQKTRKLTADERDLLNLTEVARDVFGVSDIYLLSYGRDKNGTAETKVNAVGAADVIRGIQSAVEGKTIWNQGLSKVDLGKVKLLENQIKNVSGENSYTWAWWVYQKGEKDLSKSILTKSFDQSYKETMALTRLVGKNSNYLQKAEAASKALIPMSSQNENKQNEQKLQKMRLHISDIPDLQIMT